MAEETRFTVVSGQPDEYETAALAVVLTLLARRRQDPGTAAPGRPATWLTAAAYNPPGDWSSNGEYSCPW